MIFVSFVGLCLKCGFKKVETATRCQLMFEEKAVFSVKTMA